MTAGRDTVALSVVVPTIGRPEQLRACLASIASCRPRPAEVVVIDQSGSAPVQAVVETYADIGARWLHRPGRGAAAATNAGLREAAHDLVARTDDDCTVAEDWIAVMWQGLAKHPGWLLTGRVLAGGVARPEDVPSVKADEVAVNHTAGSSYWLLYSGNMVVDRREIAAVGGFDERRSLRSAASDNDLCYRWTKSGRPLRYEPTMVVWHHDWRGPEGLARRYVEYGHGQGAFYAKHLRAGDRALLRALGRDMRDGLRAVAGGLVRRRSIRTDPRWGLLRGLPAGLAMGWRDRG